MWIDEQLTCPFWSRLLFVSLTFWNEISCFIHCAPVAGESGCMKSFEGSWGSALPATFHSLPVNLYRQSSARIRSSKMKYFCFGSRPDTEDFSVGNILLKFKMINVLLTQSCFCSYDTPYHLYSLILSNTSVDCIACDFEIMFHLNPNL